MTSASVNSDSTDGGDTHQPKPQGAEAVAWVAEKAGGAARVRSRVVTRAAAHNPPSLADKAHITWRNVLIQTPLPDVTGQVQDTLDRATVGIEPDGRDPFEFALDGVGPSFLPLPPGVWFRGVAPGGRLLPLPLGGQAHLVAEACAEPFAQATGPGLRLRAWNKVVSPSFALRSRVPDGRADDGGSPRGGVCGERRAKQLNATAASACGAQVFRDITEGLRVTPSDSE